MLMTPINFLDKKSVMINLKSMIAHTMMDYAVIQTIPTAANRTERKKCPVDIFSDGARWRGGYSPLQNDFEQTIILDYYRDPDYPRYCK